MKIFQAALVFTAIASAALPVPALSGGQTTIAIPEIDEAIILSANGAFHFRAFGAEHAVEFAGPVELTGTYYYGGNQYNDTNTTDLSVYFAPDKASLARLPHFKLRGQPGDIFLTNPGAFRDAAIPRPEREAVQKKGAKYLSGRIDIWVDQLEAGIECDAPYFNARFLRMAQPPMRVALANMPDEGC